MALTADRQASAPGFARLKAGLGTLGPARTVFLASLLLSLLALQKGTLNRDGMLYVETARAFMADGFSAAMTTFNWPFLPLLMALISQATGLHPETSGHVLNALFMAGACALLVACSRRMFPEAGWYVGLVVLALPGLNDYRDELLREYGCWFFCMLALWLALRWSDRPTWTLALVAQGMLGVAALFRPEALALLPALLLWQWFAAPGPERWKRLAMMGSLSAIAFFALMALLVTDQLNAGRIAGDFQRLALNQFAAKTEALAGVLSNYGQEQAGLILFFGSLAIIPVKFAGKMGIFLVPLLYAFVGQSLRQTLSRNSLFAWVFLAHLLVLCVFVLEMQFLAGRYIAPLLLFSAPLAGYGFLRLVHRFPAWKLPLVFLALLIATSNVITFAPPKRHFIEAGEWLSANAEDTPRVYIDSARAAYYAGWRFSSRPSPEKRTELIEGLKRKEYDLVILEVTRKESAIASFLAQWGLAVVIEFHHPGGDRIIVARPIAASSQDNEVSAASIRANTVSSE